MTDPFCYGLAPHLDLLWFCSVTILNNCKYQAFGKVAGAINLAEKDGTKPATSPTLKSDALVTTDQPLDPPSLSLRSWGCPLLSNTPFNFAEKNPPPLSCRTNLVMANLKVRTMKKGKHTPQRMTLPIWGKKIKGLVWLGLSTCAFLNNMIIFKSLFGLIPVIKPRFNLFRISLWT